MRQTPKPWVAWLTLAAYAPSFAQQPPPPAAPKAQEPGTLTDDEFRLPLDPPTAADVDRLIPLLNAPGYKDREKATQDLLQIGAPAFAKLRDAYAASADLEVQLRIEQTVRTAYLNRYIFDKYGFLGVSLAPVQTKVHQGPKAVEVENTVQIRQVIADTGASRAGLKAEDIVTALNGAPVAGTGQDAIARFSETIRTFAPGTKVRLKIEREGKPMAIDAVVGRCPEETARRGGVRFSGEYANVSARFEEWWYRFFLRTDLTRPGE